MIKPAQKTTAYRRFPGLSRKAAPAPTHSPLRKPMVAKSREESLSVVVATPMVSRSSVEVMAGYGTSGLQVGQRKSEGV
jgi:hypothetical protein